MNTMDEYGNDIITEGQAICVNCRFYRPLFCAEYNKEVEPCDDCCHAAYAFNGWVLETE